MRRWALRLGIPLAVIALIWVLRLTVLAPEPLQVRVEDVARGQVEATITNSRAGTVTARRRAQLSPEVGGQVLALPFREGDSVSKGDVILKLDARTQEASLVLRQRELDAAKAEENRACVSSERSHREMERFQRLAGDQLVSVDLLDAAESAYLGARAACTASGAQSARARAAVSLARTELAKAVLRAPFDGIIAELSVEVGEWTTPSPPGLPIPAVIDIIDPSSIYISAPMDEVDSASIKVGQAVRATIDSHRGEAFSGWISRVAPYVLDIQEQNRTVEVEAELENSTLASKLLPGTSADLEVILETRDDVLRIPTGALIEGSAALVLEAGVLHERRLEVGIRNWNFTEVTSGLAEGDSVVVSLDQAGIEDGVEAESVSDSDASAAASAAER